MVCQSRRFQRFGTETHRHSLQVGEAKVEQIGLERPSEVARPMEKSNQCAKHHMDIVQKLGDLWNRPRTAELFQEQGHLNRLRSLVFEDTSQTIPGAAV